MSAEFCPDYTNIVDAARNIDEHIISVQTVEQVTGTELMSLLVNESYSNLKSFFKVYNNFFKDMGYDTVSWESCITGVLPGAGALGGHVDPAIKNRRDFEAYPWDDVVDLFFDKFGNYYRALGEEMPEGMKAIGGVGNGVFESVQDLVGYEPLCMIKVDDQGLYEDLFRKMGDISVSIWERFLDEFGQIYAVCRFGDDLGFKSSTLFPPDDIRERIIPEYKRVIELVHSAGKPFLLHCCGNIFSVMDDLIQEAGIDAKHSNEDQIAPFSTWLEKYSDKIGNFGGIDMDILCRYEPEKIKEYTINVLEYSKGHKGVAFGSGNSIPDYIPPSGYLAMVNAVREYRGDF